MRTNKMIFALALMIGMGLYSCEELGVNDNDIKPDTPLTIEESKGAMRTAGYELDRLKVKLRELGISGPGAAFFMRNNGRTDKEVCYTETRTEFDDGSYEWIIDFQGGCDLYGEVMTGTIKGSGSSTDNSYTDTLEYIDFNTGYMTMNGIEINSGTWSEPIYDDSLEYDDEYDDLDDYQDSYWEPYESTYEFSSNLEISFDDDSMQYSGTWITSGKESIDEFGWTVEAMNEIVEMDNGDRFTNEVTTPLFMDFECEDSYGIYVSGVEESTWSSSEESGSETIDYGDGECDTLAEITIDGETEVIDLAEEWFDGCEDWDDHDEDDDTDD